jgi:serine protease AprX
MQYVQVVRTVMCGAGMHQRFTQESPILPDVWALYLEHDPIDRREKHRPFRANLLLEPWSEVPPVQVAERLAKHFAERKDESFAATETVCNRTMVVSDLTLTDLIDHIIPMSGWYIHLLQRRPSERIKEKSRTARARSRSPKAPSDGRLPAVPTRSQMWEDIIRPPQPTYLFPELLALIRMVGVIGFRVLHCDEAHDKELEDCLQAIASSNRETSDGARKHLVEIVLAGLTEGLKLTGFPEPENDPSIYAVNRNRHASLALKHSVKTVKGDAATRLFNIECRQITWAVMDCGIDARHPAFLDRSKVPDDDPDDVTVRFKNSRVVETYDFTRLRDILLGRTDNLEPHFLAGVDPQHLIEMKRRIAVSRSVDWELLRPVLRVPHDDSYAVPNDSHGTHVAGILGANWPNDGNPVMGMCRDIKIIDLRVCRLDGTSDEFIIISALQFLRHLNGNADSPYILGVNMSLSIPHDPTAFACGQTPVCVEAERTVASGAVVVAAAGNFGYRRLLDEHSESVEQFCPVSITDPGNAEGVITVGSTHRIEPHTYGVSYFSSRGPTGDGRNKPDLLAPGEKIIAPALDDRTMPLDGTSMAAPHVSGAAALLMARHVELKGRPGRIKEILCSTATDLGRERYFQGHGLVDVLRALQSV